MDIKNVKLLHLKAALFVLGGSMAAAGILLEAPTLRVAALHITAIWCFARAYNIVF